MANQFLESPVTSNKFIWLAAYSDGSALTEFNYDTLTENSFYSIDKDKLIRFGLIGYGMNMYYEVLGGTFKIAGQAVDVIYRTKDKDYYLTGHRAMCNDIIQYKNAETALNPSGGITEQITQYNYGYKHNLAFEDVNFNFKAICSIPYGQPVYLNIRLVSDVDLDGVLIVRKNSLQSFEFDAQMQAGVAYEINWQVVV